MPPSIFRFPPTREGHVLVNILHARYTIPPTRVVEHLHHATTIVLTHTMKSAIVRLRLLQSTSARKWISSPWITAQTSISGSAFGSGPQHWHRVAWPLSHPVIPRSWCESQRIGLPGTHRIVSSVILRTDDGRQATPRVWAQTWMPGGSGDGLLYTRQRARAT